MAVRTDTQRQCYTSTWESSGFDSANSVAGPWTAAAWWGELIGVYTYGRTENWMNEYVTGSSAWTWYSTSSEVPLTYSSYTAAATATLGTAQLYQAGFDYD